MIWGRKTETRLCRKKGTSRDPHIPFLLNDTPWSFTYLTAFLPYPKKEPSEDQLKQRARNSPGQWPKDHIWFTWELLKHLNIGVVLFFQISDSGSFGYIPRSGIAGSKGRSIFNYLSISILLSTVAAPICIPTNSAKRFPFLHVLASTCCFSIYWW